MLVEGGAGGSVAAISADFFECGIGDDAGLDAGGGVFDQLGDTGQFHIERTRGDDAEHPWQAHFKDRLAGDFAGDRKEG